MPPPFPPRNKALIRPNEGTMVVNSPLIRPAISWGFYVALGPGSGPLRLPSLIPSPSLPMTKSVHRSILDPGRSRFSVGFHSGKTLLGGSSQDLDTWLITMVYKWWFLTTY